MLCLAVVVVAVGIGALASRIRNDTVPPVAILGVTAGCAIGLISMILTDWPLEVLDTFWADHSVLASMLSSLLLVGIVFLVYERNEQRQQEERAVGISGAGVGGIVDHVVEVELALALIAIDVEPAVYLPEHWADWNQPGKPLRWARSGREILGTARDPRLQQPIANLAGQPWHEELIDQSIWRILAAMRDWAPLIGSSQDGISTLLLLSRTRNDLMHLQAEITDSDRASGIASPAEALNELRARLRVMAACFETWSGVPRWRNEVLTTLTPLPHARPDFGAVNRTLSHRLNAAFDQLAEGDSQVSSPVNSAKQS